MMLGLLGPFPLLLVLLGSWGPVPLAARPRNFTRVQWFQFQHIRPRPVNCQTEMRPVYLLDRRCKNQNTFLHDTFQNVAATCLLHNMNCSNGQNNCYRSANRISMTHCNLTGGRFPKCNYHTTLQNLFYVVACNDSQPGFPPSQLLPVHLDNITHLVHLHFG